MGSHSIPGDDTLCIHSFQFKHPATIIISGPTQAGKTEFVIKLLKNIKTLFDPPPARIVWAYGQENNQQNIKISAACKNIKFHEGIPANLDEFDEKENNLLVLDDLMDEIGKSPECSNLFTKGSHHKNITAIAIVHNLFNQEKFSRTISLNSLYYVIFNSPRDRQQIRYFGRQIYPDHPKFIPDALNKATMLPFGYLVIDLHPRTHNKSRAYSGIFPDELPVIYEIAR